VNTTYPHHRPEKGAILFLYMVMIGLIAFVIHQLVSHAATYAVLARDFRAGQAALSELREKLPTMSLTTRGCENHEISLSGSTRSIATCTLGSPPLRASAAISLPAGRVDYATIFAQARACPGSVEDNPSRSFSSPEAWQNCRLPERLEFGFTVLENVEATEITIGAPEPSPQPLLVATPGRLTISGRIVTSQPLLILAGGEISIDTIASVGEQLVPITLLSAHGSISVRAIEGSPSLLLIGRNLLTAPSTPIHPPFPLPSFRAVSSMSGFIATLGG